MKFVIPVYEFLHTKFFEQANCKFIYLELYTIDFRTGIFIENQ